MVATASKCKVVMLTGAEEFKQNEVPPVLRFYRSKPYGNTDPQPPPWGRSRGPPDTGAPQ